MDSFSSWQFLHARLVYVEYYYVHYKRFSLPVVKNIFRLILFRADENEGEMSVKSRSTLVARLYIRLTKRIQSSSRLSIIWDLKNYPTPLSSFFRSYLRVTRPKHYQYHWPGINNLWHHLSGGIIHSFETLSAFQPRFTSIYQNHTFDQRTVPTTYVGSTTYNA